MGDKISQKFKGVEKALLNMYDKSIEHNQVMYYLCHIVLLDQKKIIDDVILAWGTKGALEIIKANKRAFSNPTNIVDVNNSISIVSIFDHQEKYKTIADALKNLHNRYPNIKYYCTIAVKENKYIDTALFATGELNILENMQSFVETLICMPENIQDGHIVRWQMTSF